MTGPAQEVLSIQGTPQNGCAKKEWVRRRMERFCGGPWFQILYARKAIHIWRTDQRTWWINRTGCICPTFF